MSFKSYKAVAFFFAAGTALFTFSNRSHAQFGNLLQTLQKIQIPNQEKGTVQAATVGKPSQKNRGALLPSDQWCNSQVGALGKLKIDTSLIATEFKITELESLQDEFLKAFKTPFINKTFPNARFFKASFETKKVRALYDSFLAFPEPDTLAALIQVSKHTDVQERGDALMALTFLQLQAPHLAADPNKWWANYQNAMATEHYTATVFRARLAAYGEYGKKDIGAALGYLVSAGNLPSQYRSSGMGKEFDTQNYQMVHTATAKDIFLNEPNMPYREQWKGPAQTAMQIEQAQLAFARQLPNTRLGKMYAEAARLNQDSIHIGNDLIKSTQSGNQLAGQLANLDSLKSTKSGDKEVFVDMDPGVQSAQLKMFAKVDALGEDQKRMLQQAHEKRLTAQGIVSQTYSDLMAVMLGNFGDMVKMAAPLPALQTANDSLIQSCIISRKWEQAMRARDVSQPDKKKASEDLAALAKKYSDD